MKGSPISKGFKSGCHCCKGLVSKHSKYSGFCRNCLNYNKTAITLKEAEILEMLEKGKNKDGIPIKNLHDTISYLKPPKNK